MDIHNYEENPTAESEEIGAAIGLETGPESSQDTSMLSDFPLGCSP